jgi:RNA polymerase sigma-70 factor (ECF subfamily)
MSRGDVRTQFNDALIGQLPALRRYAVALCGSAVMGDDLVQDCIERALKQSDQLRDSKRIAAWLRSILHNLFMDELRRRRSRGIEEDIAELTDDFALSVPAADRAEFHEFTAAMDTLGAEHRQILLLVGLEGLSYREIAQELRIPIGTVMSRLARARSSLRHALENGSRYEVAEIASLAAYRKKSP